MSMIGEEEQGMTMNGTDSFIQHGNFEVSPTLIATSDMYNGRSYCPSISHSVLSHKGVALHSLLSYYSLQDVRYIIIYMCDPL